MSGTLSQIGQDVRAVGGLASSVSSLLGGLSFGAWFNQLQPASWRGIGFAVNSSEYTRGRRTAVHEYPFRDDVWVEDLGRAARGVAFSGFVVGDDCYAQAKALLTASETPGSGQLIHPSLGSLTVSLVAPMRGTERKELGRVVEISFAFVETGISAYPDSSASTGDVSDDAADDADDASQGDFLGGIGDALAEGDQVAAAGLATTGMWLHQVGSLASDASLITGAVSGLAGNFGRYSNGNRSSLLAGVSTARGAISAVITARAGIAAASSSVLSLVGGM